jgi:Uma2 family endonuclease
MAQSCSEWRLYGGVLFNILKNYLKGKKCKVFAELDVYFSETDRFVPDVMIVCDRDKIKPDGVHGAPDLIVEILSPGTAKRDRTVKMDKYSHYGVREYWIVYPDSKTVSVHVLKDGEYMTREYGEADTIKVRVLDGCEISLSEAFVW